MRMESDQKTEIEPKASKKLKSEHQNGAVKGNIKTKQIENISNSSVVLQVHHCKFFEWMPSLIGAVAFSPDGKYLAVGLANGNVEIRNIKNGWLTERVIPGRETLSIRSLAWTSDYRLFASSLHAKIVEFDLNTLKAKKIVDSYGGPVWGISIDTFENQIAAACDDGTIKLFDISEGKLQYFRTLPKIEGRMMSVCWHPDGTSVYGGASDSTIRKYEIKDFSNSLVIKSQFKLSTIIWSLTVLSDNTIISGDSLGNTQFWDGNQGVLLYGWKQHEADVLSVVANEKLGIAFSSGIDSKVVFFQLVKENDFTKWVCSLSQRLHTHDVRALALSSKFLVSGGNEARLGVYPVSEFRDNGTFIKLSPLPQKPIVSFSKDPTKRLLLLQHERKLVLWQLGRVSNQKIPLENRKTGDLLKLKEDAAQLLELKPHCDVLVSSTLSPDGQYISCSDYKGVKLFKLTYVVNQSLEVSVKRVKLPETLKNTMAIRMLFTNDSSKLILAGSDHKIYVLDIESNAIQHVFENHADIDQENQPAPICTLAVSEDNKYLASGDLNNTIHIFNLESFTLHSTLPKFESIHTTFAFSPREPLLAVVCSNNVFFFYDVVAERLNDWTRANLGTIPKDYLNVKAKVVGIAFHPTISNSITLYTERHIFFVTLEKTEVKEVNLYHGVLLADYLNEKELVVVDRPWKHVLPHLPDPLYRVRYGI